MAREEKVSERRSPEWRQQFVRWRWLLDSFEGGEAYRQASYGNDTHGFPVRNLVRHKREYPSGRSTTSGQRAQHQDYAQPATDDDYELRRARTPVPTFLADVINTHHSHVFAEEIKRETTATTIETWWQNVDGKGSKIDTWMQATVAPLLMALGQIDLLFDRPKAPPNTEIQTQADVLVYGLDRVVATHILPEHVVWWELDEQDQYREVIVEEFYGDGSKPNYRHWRPDGWTLYDAQGKAITAAQYNYGRPPIVRVFDRKRPRCRNVGLPRWEAIAELQREFYNRDSELILSDTTQAHPLLQGPEDVFGQDGSIAVGPGWVLPKKRYDDGSGYEGFDVVNFPKEGAESIRQNLQLLRDRIDRAAQLTKPAGAQGTTGNSVSQSGLSKRLDQSSGNKLLADIAATLQRCEVSCVAMVALVAGDKAAVEATSVVYPRKFDLWTSDELIQAAMEFDAAVAAAGDLPETDFALYSRIVRLLMPGMDDDDYRPLDAELVEYLASRKDDREAAREAAPQGAFDESGGLTDGEDEGNSDGTERNDPADATATSSGADAA